MSSNNNNHKDTSLQLDLNSSPSPLTDKDDTKPIIDSTDSTSLTDLWTSRFSSPSSRLSTPFPLRLPLAATFGLLTGFFIGAAKGATRASYQFRAENAHRLPTTRTGWYLYHKTKNYKSIAGGVGPGLRLGAVLAVWAGVFVGVEEVVDNVRGRALVFGGGREEQDLEERSRHGAGEYRHRDVASTVCAGMAVVGIHSWRRDWFTAARMARIGFKVSLAYGLTQDLVSVIRGRPPAYTDWLRTRVWGLQAARRKAEL